MYDEDTEVEESGAILQERVGFYSPKYSLRLEITHPQSLTADPAAAQHPERKMAQFIDGLYSTDDPDVIAALDKHKDVYRVDDPQVRVLEAVASEEPEEKAKALRLLEKVGGIGEFSKTQAKVPGFVRTGD